MVARLAAYDWPGNVRQLLNVIRQIVIASRGEAQALLPETVEVLLAGARPAATPSEPAPSKTPPAHPKPSQIGDDALVELLRAHRFNLRAAAAAAGISPTSLYALVEKCPRLRKPAEIGPRRARGEPRAHRRRRRRGGVRARGLEPGPQAPVERARPALSRPAAPRGRSVVVQ